jgi:hypothetical protein
MAKFTKSKLIKAITLSTPLIIGCTLIGCGDDNKNLTEINTSSSYEFNSARNADNPVDYIKATTALLLIDELDKLISSNYLQTYGQEHGIQDTVKLLNRVYNLGTNQSDPTSLWNSNIYATEVAESTPLNAAPLTNELLNYSQLAPNINLKSISPGTELPLHNRKPSLTIGNQNDTSEEVGDFIGWGITGFQDGDLVFDAMIQQWFVKIAELASDSEVSTRFIKDNINYRLLITTTLKASIPYFQISQNYLEESTLRDLAINRPDTLKSQWDLGFGYSGMASHPNAKVFSSSNDQWANGAENLTDLKQNKISNAALYALQADEGSPFVDITFFKDLHTGFLTGRSLLSLEQPNLTEDEATSLLYKTSNNLIDTWEKALVAKLVSHMNEAVNEANTVKTTKIHHDAFIDAWSNLKACALALQFNPRSPISVDQLIEMHTDIGRYPPGTNATREFQSALVVDRLDDQAMRNILQNLYGFSTPDIESW